ncbi:nucleotidyltransferase domain-containing protein [Thiosulfativibrio zosterae]|uniref:Polymerase beta nucleotidyltransferase domain-containing protein n=1 Tax=Thiosulfativibrio zosterae TaxID=2675053 RepID=A0A6F8PQ22_9GAMM|nr:nucleotidyltransferase domain-containing protein [Thiosulfativibrio zosterae]BBP44209.1 hypothetical protein THMIRHAT_19550 [Thiosulfativibrio zosterae]
MTAILKKTELPDAFGLKASTIHSIQQVLWAHPEIQKAVIYGSRAKGTFKKGSDIDLTLFTFDPQQQQLSLLAEIANQIDELDFLNQVDLSWFDQIENQDLIDHINRVGCPFFDRADYRLTVESHH